MSLRPILEQKLIKNIKKALAAFDSLFKAKSRLLIIVHNNPDPDALASAAALSYLAKERYQADTSIACGGAVGRAENRVLLRHLKIRLKQIKRIRLSSYNLFAFVDTQPSAGNHPPLRLKNCHFVFDHHPLRAETRAELLLIYPELGATATILTLILRSLKLAIPSNLATALTYALSSETQNLKREATRLDLEAYLWVYVKANLRMLAEIMQPNLSHSYFRLLLMALKQALVFRNLICIHLQEISQPEIVSEMANFFLRHERISWVLVTGRFGKDLILSLRTRAKNRHAGELLSHIAQTDITVGGHEHSAGGFLASACKTKEEAILYEQRLQSAFALQLGLANPEWKSLLD